MFKKMMAILMACMMVLTMGTAACAAESAQPLKIVCTTFPQYDWVRQVLGDNLANVELTLLIDNGVDLHSYQPTVADLAKLADCDLFIYVGGESDEWVEDALLAANNPRLKAISMLENVEAKEEEMVEGMQESEHNHDHGDHDHDHDHSEAITEENIQARELSDFAGEWMSLWPMMQAGELDEFCEHKAEGTEGATVESMREKYTASWECAADTMVVTGDKITFTFADGTSVTGTYTYAGYTPKYAEDGCISSVRYQYETADADAPRYVQFNDHGHEPGLAEHFHVYFGNESFEALMTSATNPYFVTAGSSVEEILEGLMGHSHDQGHDHDHSEAITEENIEARELADFAGEWKSLWPMMQAGELDEFCEHKAEDSEDDSITMEAMREKYTTVWACEANSMTVTGDQITFNYADGTSVTGTYTYAGYTPKYAEDGCISSVRYQYETTDANAPKYVQFNDHGHKPGLAEHFHVYFGNESFEALMTSATNPYFVTAGSSVEEILEGLMGHSHGDNHEHGHDHDHEGEADEHVWLSLRNAQILTQTIADALCELDAANADQYQANAAAYKAQLAELDAKYQAVADAAAHDTVLFADRFPFRYLVDDYGLNYYAAFVGCSAETEASFETIVFLAQKVDELGLDTVLVIEGAQHSIADTVVAATQSKNQQIMTMNSVQSVTAKDVAEGASYLALMEGNLAAFEAALD